MGSLSDDTPIARYFGAKKLIRIINSQEIWFSDIGEFSDKRERKIPEEFFYGWSVDSKNGFTRINNGKNKVIKSYVSCWTKFDAENYALWKIYDKNSNGACLVTTVGKLKTAINREDLIMCKVDYINCNKKQRIDLPWVFYNENSSFNCMRVIEKYKIMPYKYENEIRSIIYSTSKEKGISIKVDLKSIIDEAYISPFSNKKQVDLTKKRLKKCFDESIIRHSMIME